jgi:deoxyribodipyrimidine photolyase-related protein
MINIILIYPTQLFDYNKYYKFLIDNNIKTFFILLEDDYFFNKYKYHKLKLILHKSTMEYFYNKLINLNNDVIYLENKNMYKLNNIIKKLNPNIIKIYDPIEKDLINNINEYKKYYNLQILKSPMFLNGSNDNLNIYNQNNFIKHSSFYKLQRIKYNLLIDKNNNPLYNKWSFDIHNRNKFPKDINEDNIMKYKINNNKHVINAKLYINKFYKNNYGNDENFIYPITHNESKLWLKNFIKYKLNNFGEYEDGIHSDILIGYHSCLTPILNIGLLTPHDIINEIKKIKINKNNIYSIEGFIRQIIGWREYCYFIYDLYGNNLKKKENFYYKDNNNKLTSNIWNGNTNIIYIDNIINKVINYAYCHHIERLMCISNYFNLLNINPKEIYKWFMIMFIDAYQVFMIPNVYGMALYGYIKDNKHMMMKPYISSSNYILK